MKVQIFLFRKEPQGSVLPWTFITWTYLGCIFFGMLMMELVILQSQINNHIRKMEINIYIYMYVYMLYLEFGI